MIKLIKKLFFGDIEGDVYHLKNNIQNFRIDMEIFEKKIENFEKRMETLAGMVRTNSHNLNTQSFWRKLNKGMIEDGEDFFNECKDTHNSDRLDKEKESDKE